MARICPLTPSHGRSVYPVLCPFCANDSQVVDSRTTAEAVRRRRVCGGCKRRFTTYERLGAPNLKVIKYNDKVEPFESQKLRRVIERVCRHRSSVQPSDIDRIVRSIETELLAATVKTIHSGRIAQLLLTRLADIDQVAYDRFAANYIDEDGHLRVNTKKVPDATPAQSELFE